jgi:colanic acid/amylovoran biosynthesis glycosyltransferase
MTSSPSPRTVIAAYMQRYCSPTMTFVYRQLQGLRREFDTLLLTSNRATNLDRFPFNPLYEKEKNPAERLQRLLKKGLGSYATLSHAQRDYFLRVLRDHGPAAIHAHFGPSGIEALPLARTLDIPLLTSFHGYDASEILANRRYAKALKELLEYSHITVASEYMFERLAPFGARKEATLVLYYGIPVEDYRYVERKPVPDKIRDGEEIKFLQVSGLVEKKGHCYSLQAFANVLTTYPHCSYTIAGDGPLRKELELQTRALGIGDKVKFIGGVSSRQVSSLMSASDLFLHHSVTPASGDQEGIPNAIMEAMATGLTAVSTRHAGIPELISHGRNGYLVGERDVKDYTETLETALQNFQPLGTAASRTIREKFNLSHQNALLCNYIRKIIDARQRS